MFGVDSTELLLIILVAVVVIGPKDLPRVLSAVGKWVGKARGMANQFKSGVNDMVRDSEIADLEKKWREQNDEIMRANPLAKPDSDWGKPAEPAPPAPVTDAAPIGDTARPAPGAPSSASGGQPAPIKEAQPPAEPVLQDTAEVVPLPSRAPPRAPKALAPVPAAPREQAAP